MLYLAACFAFGFWLGVWVMRRQIRQVYQPRIDQLHDYLDEARVAASPSFVPDKTARLRLP
jgi:hypothetical protein